MLKRAAPILSLQILAVLVVATALALLANAARKHGLPLVVPFPPEYRCPTAAGAANPIEAAAALHLFGKPGTVFVDSRTREEFDRGHIEGAASVPCPFLEPLPASAVSFLKRHERVIVYCSAKGAEVSRLMAGELAAKGVKGVSYLSGGFLGWAETGGRVTGQAPKGHGEPG